MDKVFDLLARSEHNTTKASTQFTGGSPTTVSRTHFEGSKYVKVRVRTSQEALQLYEKGNHFRRTGAHDMNANSSRSHSLFFVYVEKRAGGTTVCSKVTFVDLAGSERVSKTHAAGEVFKEGIAINKSLTSLQDVMQALSKKRPLVPFRQNILTMCLRDSLLNAFTAIICCCSSSLANVEETICTLQFGLIVKKVEITRTQNIKKAVAQLDLPPAFINKPDELAVLTEARLGAESRLKEMEERVAYLTAQLQFTVNQLTCQEKQYQQRLADLRESHVLSEKDSESKLNSFQSCINAQREQLANIRNEKAAVDTLVLTLSERASTMEEEFERLNQLLLAKDREKKFQEDLTVEKREPSFQKTKIVRVKDKAQMYERSRVLDDMKRQMMSSMREMNSALVSQSRADIRADKYYKAKEKAEGRLHQLINIAVQRMALLKKENLELKRDVNDLTRRLVSAERRKDTMERALKRHSREGRRPYTA